MSTNNNNNHNAATGSSPVCVNDTFHFSHYWVSDSCLSVRSGLTTAVSTSVSTDSDSVASVGLDVDSDNGEETTTDKEYYLPKVVSPDDIKLQFYAQVMGDESNNFHFGKWFDVKKVSGTNKHISSNQTVTNTTGLAPKDAYGKATGAMTDFMFEELALPLLPHRHRLGGGLTCVDLGSGTGSAAARIAERHDASVLASVTCLNLCHAQNAQAEKTVEKLNLHDRIRIAHGNYEDASRILRETETYDLVFSQDAFIHAVSKRRAYEQAFRLTKPGGAMVFCDVMAGESQTIDERANYAKHNALNDFLSVSENEDALEDSGWKQVSSVDMTRDMRRSFELMLQRSEQHLVQEQEAGNKPKVLLLQNYAAKIRQRLQQIDADIIQWVVVTCRKPVTLQFFNNITPPVPFVNTNELILEPNLVDAVPGDKTDTEVSFAIPATSKDTSVVVIDILQKMTREKIFELPDTVQLLITLSAGLDHIDMRACAERGIAVRQAGREAITSHVVQYVLSFLIIGLRNALPQLGVPFPSKGWNLRWNCDEGNKPLTESKIAIVGMGVIAKELVRNIRLLAPTTTILYHVPPIFREEEAEEMYNLEYCPDLGDMASQCDVLAPMCPLTKGTEHIVNAEILARMPSHAGLINMARGKVVDTDAMTKALQDKQLPYAILDTTFPEPLPEDHPLWTTENCFILPHFATNTMTVRRALVEEIQPLVEEHYGLAAETNASRRAEQELKEQEEQLRYDLAVAHRLTAKHGMDMMTWNHISARFQNGCLITSGRELWSQVKPEDLVFSSSNVTADLIHAAIYEARDDIGAIIHVHTPAATAVSCLEGGFVPMTQDAAYFYKKVANYEWDGVSNEASEGPAITKAVQSLPGCNTLLMEHHGFVCFGKTVREAWVLAYYFERCCEVQLRVMQCGGKYKLPPAAVMESAAQASYLPEFAPGACEWEALCRDITF